MIKSVGGIRVIFCAALIAASQGVGAGDTLDPVATVDAFQAALVNGDAALARSLLATDVLIYESGGQETSRDEYTSHHMKGDIAFLGRARITKLDQSHHVHGDLAVVSTRSRITGKHKDKAVDIHSTQTMVLKRAGAGWQIAHIHWSSRSIEPKAK